MVFAFAMTSFKVVRTIAQAGDAGNCNAWVAAYFMGETPNFPPDSFRKLMNCFTMRDDVLQGG